MQTSIIEMRSKFYLRSQFYLHDCPPLSRRQGGKAYKDLKLSVFSPWHTRY